MSSNSGLGLLGLATTLAVAAGCSSNAATPATTPALPASSVQAPTRTPGPPPAARTTALQPASAATSSGRFTQPYINALEDFIAAYGVADAAGTLLSAELARTSSGPALTWAKRQLREHAKLGVAHRGHWSFRDVGAVDVTRSSARVGQCMDWSAWPVANRVTGATYQAFPGWSQLVTADMVSTDGHWRVNRISIKTVAC